VSVPRITAQARYRTVPLRVVGMWLNVSNAATNVRALYYVSEIAGIPATCRRSNSLTSSRDLFELVDHYPKIGKTKHHIAVTNRPRAQKAATMTSSEFVIIATSRCHAGFADSPRRWGFSKGRSSRLTGIRVTGPLLLSRPTDILAYICG
jgi:hypothetical protein